MVRRVRRGRTNTLYGIQGRRLLSHVRAFNAVVPGVYRKAHSESRGAGVSAAAARAADRIARERRNEWRAFRKVLESCTHDSANRGVASCARYQIYFFVPFSPPSEIGPCAEIHGPENPRWLIFEYL